MPAFARYIGIDYSGAETPTASLKGLRVYLADGDAPPVEVPPPPSPRKYWTRRGIAEWLVERLAEDTPTLVGIDHGFSFPLRYFEVHRPAARLASLPRRFPAPLADRRGSHLCRFRSRRRDGNGAARMGNARWRRLTEERAGGANRCFISTCRDRWRNPPMPGFRGCASSASSLARACISGRSTAGTFRRALGHRRSLSGAVETQLCPRRRTADQHDAYSIAAWLSRADRNGTLRRF